MGEKAKDGDIIYPTPERIAEYNLFVLTMIDTKKGDKAEILSYSRIVDIVEGCKSFEGDIYDKATFLMKSLIQKHPFASGNRRTAFIVTKEFLADNHTKFNIPDEPANARVMVGIRENYYTDLEIKGWIRDGKIREFRR